VVVWYALSSVHPLGENTWHLTFVRGALPVLFVLYIRRGVNESEQWQRAVREKRWNAKSGLLAAGAAVLEKRPFSLAQLFNEREARRRTLLLVVLSNVTTVGWSAISRWLPTFTMAITKAQGLPVAHLWGSKVSIIYTVGAIVAYLVAGPRGGYDRPARVHLADVRLFARHHVHNLQAGDERRRHDDGFFTLGCAYAWMGICPGELFAVTVRSTAINAARLIGWVFPIIAGSMIKSFGGVAQAALAVGSVYLLGIVLP
jgi:hypothetical protein